MLEQDINRPAWTSYSLQAQTISSCPKPGEAKCQYRFFDGNGLSLFCFCKLNGRECLVLLAGQKHLWGLPL